MIADNLHGKTRQLGDYILEQIYTGYYTPGTAIPSIRAYMEQFGMSQRTVQRTLEILVERGILETRHGRGTFVKPRQQKTPDSSRVVAVTLWRVNLETSIYGNVFLGLQQAALEQGYQLNVTHIPLTSKTPGKEQLNKLISGTKGLILLSEEDERLRDNRLPVPVVGVCMCDNYDDTVSLIDLDPFSSARLAGDYFRKNGVEKVHVFSSDVPSYMIRGSVFADQWRAQGRECELQVVTTPVTDTPDIPAGSALLFTTGSTKESFLRVYHKRTGVRLEETCLILELDGKTQINPDYIKTSSIAPDWKQIGRLALDEIVFRVGFPGIPPRRVLLPGKLHIEEQSGEEFVSNPA